MDYDRVIVMEAGRIVEEGTPTELLQKSSGAHAKDRISFLEMAEALGSNQHTSLRRSVGLS